MDNFKIGSWTYDWSAMTVSNGHKSYDMKWEDDLLSYYNTYLDEDEPFGWTALNGPANAAYLDYVVEKELLGEQ